MTRQQFENLKVGDNVLLYGVNATVVCVDNGTYDAKSRAFDNGRGLCVVTFAWNEGEIINKKGGEE